MMAFDFLSTSNSEKTGIEFEMEKHLCFAVGSGRTRVKCVYNSDFESHTSFVFTFEISPGTSVSTSYITGCPLSVFGHAGSISHRFCRVQVVSGSFFRLLHSPDESSFGVLVVAIPFIAALPSFALMGSLKLVSAPIAPVLVATVFTVEA